MTGPRDAARGNGLAAGAWTVLGDVDPRVVPALLASLAEHGIAAFALPSPGSRGGYLDVHLPARPVDQLHVDAARRDDAQALLLAIAPAATVPDDDAAFAAIVARWDDVAEERHPADRPWPASEDVEPGSTTIARPEPRVVAPLESRPPIEAWRGPTGSEPEEEHFEPPTAPPIPRPKGLTLIGLLAVLAGIALLVWTSASDTPGPDPQLGGIALLVGGTALLISRLRSKDDDNDGDDGAVV